MSEQKQSVRPEYKKPSKSRKWRRARARERNNEARRALQCEGCYGTGSLEVHNIEGECGMCNGTGIAIEVRGE